ETPFELMTEVPFLGKPLRVSITPETKTITIFYHTSPDAAAVQWLSPNQTAGGKQPFMFTQSQAILARTWLPCQDGPGIRFTYDATVQVPADLMALMSATNPQQKSADGVYSFKQVQAIPSYLMALAVGDIEFKSIDARTGVYAEPVTLEKAAYEFAEMGQMVAAAEKLYGPYRWGRYDVIVLPPSFPFGGMENPELTFATPTILAGDRSLTSLVAHELAHSWSGNLVTNATWNDFWLNEGFTVYFERRIMESLYGKSYAEMLTLLGYQDLMETMEDLGRDTAATHLKLNLIGKDPDDGMNSIAYEKGYFLIVNIEEKYGRERLDAFLNKYFASHAFHSMTTEDFLTYLDAELLHGDANFMAEIKGWIYKPGIPSSIKKVSSERFEKVNAQVADFAGGKAAATLNTKDWSSHEWLHFIRHLPQPMSLEKMHELDEAFHFTTSGNCELLDAWFEHAIHNKYAVAYPAMKKFLNSVGRRKFLLPLYKEMLKTPEGKAMAMEIYKDSRPNYHSVAVQTLDEMVGWGK
ncbi:MAG: M1 family metallopeptidase, partial [Bacteroidetes bacterium]|nr:M1 family metallopeptidase [Bacteroidota bacterium]